MPEWELIRTRVYHSTNLALCAVAPPHGISADAAFATVDPPPDRGLMFCIAISMGRARVTVVPGGVAAKLVNQIESTTQQTRSALDALRAHYEFGGLRVAFGDKLRSDGEINSVGTALLRVEIPDHEEGFDHASGTTRLVEALEAAVQLLLITLPHTDMYSDVAAVEGERISIELSHAERSPANRRACLAIHGYACKGCGDRLKLRYGDIAERLIEVHHINPLSTMNAPKPVDPLTELVPLCPNCHAVVHRKVPPLTLHELQALVNAADTAR